MKTKILMKLAVLVAVVVLAESCGPEVLPSPALGQQIVFKEMPSEEILARAAKLQVYELQPVEIDRGSFDSLAKQLFPGGLEGRPVQVNGVIGMSDAEKPSNFMMLELETGYLSFTHGMANQIDDKPGNLPSDDKAVEIARDFLRKNNLRPGNVEEMVLGRIGRVHSTSFDPRTGKKGPVRDQMLTVYLARQIDNIPVIGSGSKMIVRIGDEGEVVGGARRWTELGHGRRLKPEDLRSISELMKDIEIFLSQEMNQIPPQLSVKIAAGEIPPFPAQRIEIIQFALVYYDNGGKYIQPALGYEANVRGTNPQTGKEWEYYYFGQTALLRDPPERVGPEPVSEEARRSLRRSLPEKRPPAREAD